MKKDRLKTLIVEHLLYYPEMELRDVYKLIYQSIMGPGHILQNEEKSFSLLKDEFENNISGYEQQIHTRISLEYEIVRVNIPLYKKYGSADLLFEMTCKTAKRITPDKTLLNDYWKLMGVFIKEHRFEKFLIDDYYTLSDFLHKNSYPHLSHSDTYKKLYQPSYQLC